MRAIQLALRQQWDYQDDQVMVRWNPQCQEDLRWWGETDRLSQGCSLEVVPPDLMFWSDVSDQGWGAHLADSAVSGLWSQSDQSLSINLRELRAVR